MIGYVAVQRWELGFDLLAFPFQGEPQTRRPALATATGYRWPAATASLVSAEGNSAEPPRRRVTADIQRSKTGMTCPFCGRLTARGLEVGCGGVELRRPPDVGSCGPESERGCSESDSLPSTRVG